MAIVYDWIDKWGGVERVLLILHTIFPNADFYTSYYDYKKASWAQGLNIKTSFIETLPSFIKNSRLLSLPVYPYAFESFDFSEYDKVISVTSSFAKGIITKPETKHICYLLTPMRYLWLYPELYIQNVVTKMFTAPYIGKLREWDFIAAQRPDSIISISHTVAERCLKFYGRKSEVIYPPFDREYWGTIKSEIRNPKSETNSKFKILNSKQYFLVVSRIEPYKRLEIVIDAYLKNNTSIDYDLSQLVIVGSGSQREQLRKKAGNKVILLEKVSDEELGWLYAHAEALIMPQEEDFGYVALEAQFFGCPVIAFDKGGVTETIVEGETGLFFNSQTAESLLRTLEIFHTVSYNMKIVCQKEGPKQTERFSKENFENKLLACINL